MASFDFSTENLIALKKLELSVRKESGLRYILAEEKSLMQLIQHAYHSSSSAIQTAFSQFVLGLSPEVKQQLVYRGVAVASDTPKAPPTRTQSKRVFRGVVQEAAPAAPKEPESSSQPAKAEVTASAKPKRVYRGQVIS